MQPLKYALLFPKHHKRRHKVKNSKTSPLTLFVDILTNDNIERTTHRAFSDAYNLLSQLDVNVPLERHKINTLKQISSFVKDQFEKKFKNIAYDDIERYSSDEESSDQFQTEINSTSETDEDDSSEDETGAASVSTGDKHKFIHKQTSCWALTDDKAKLSSDRIQRVRQ